MEELSVAGKAEEGSDGSVRSTSRTMSVIEHLARADDDLGVVQIGRELRLPPSTAHRILTTLAHQGYVARDPTTARYRLTLSFLELGGLVQRRVALCDQARPHLRRLVQSTGEGAGLVAFDGRRALLVDGVENPDRTWPRLAVGSARPLHCTAAGKAILASLPVAQREVLLRDTPLGQHTEQTADSRRALDERLSPIGEYGYAVEDEEHEAGIRGVAAAIRSRSSTLGAIEILGPAIRLSMDRISQLARYVQVAAEELSLSLGYEHGAGR